jgi:Cof subfamily protein (haloacid dehalogenase superfamily)
MVQTKIKNSKGVIDMIKHIFSDMDGTLLNSAGQVSYANQLAIQNCSIPITLISARSPIEMNFAIKQLNLKNKQAAFNGGLIFTLENNVLKQYFSQPISAKTVKSIYNIVNQQADDINISWYSATQWFAKKSDSLIDFQKKITNITPIEDSQAETLDAPEFKIYKIMLLSFIPEKLLAIKNLLNQQEFPGIICQFSDNQHLEITSLNATKKNGIAFIQSEENLQKHQLAAFGDGENDLNMFECVGMPIAMQNATTIVKQHAKFTTKTNNDNGIAYGISHLVNSRI